MQPYQGFAGKTRVVKTKGHGKGRTGLVVDVNFPAGKWRVLFDDTKLAVEVNPYEFEVEQKKTVD